jgi:hypothetical protein
MSAPLRYVLSAFVDSGPSLSGSIASGRMHNYRRAVSVMSTDMRWLPVGAGRCAKWAR